MSYYAYVGSFTSENKENNRHAAGEGIHCFLVSSSLREWSEYQTVKEHNPAFIQISQSRKILYAGNSASGVPVNGIVAYHINEEDGTLLKAEHQLNLDRPICCFCERPQGDYIVAADFKGGIYTIHLNDDGTLDQVIEMQQLEGTLSPLRNITCSRPHHCLFDKSGEHLIIADKGLDLVFVFKFDAVNGRLVETCRSKVRPASCARHIAFHPNGKIVYVVAEYLCKIYVFDYDAERGLLRMKQAVSAERDTCTKECKSSEIHVHPNGAFVYVSNRGDDTIGVFSVDRDSGKLTPIEWVETEGEKPRYFTLSEAGEKLIVGNQKSGTISVFDIDSKSGRLKLAKKGVKATCPTWICISNKE